MNAVCPGTVETPSWHVSFHDDDDSDADDELTPRPLALFAFLPKVGDDNDENIRIKHNNMKYRHKA